MMAAPPLQPDTLIHDRYRVVAQIGRGGMGTVYEAVDERLGSRVALKQLLLPGAELRRAFEREARLLAALRHPALPAVSDYFGDAAGQFLVMQYIPGDDLRQLLRQRGGPFPPALVLDWADQLLAALVYLHARQPPIIHRDIKPQNLKQTTTGELVLLDFGLAKTMALAARQSGSASLPPTDPSLNAFTPQYAPIEQIEGSGTDERSDLYSLSATLYHLLTGVAPAPALARVRALVARERDPLRPAHENNPLVPSAIGAALAKGLALHAGDRPASAEELRRMLRAAGRQSEAPTVAGSDKVAPRRRQMGEPPPPAKPATRPARRLTPLLPLVIALLAVPLIAWALLRGPDGEDRTQAGVPALNAAPPAQSVSPALPQLTAGPAAVTTTRGVATVTIEPSVPTLELQPAQLGETANASLDFQAPPAGDVTFEGIPFRLSGRAWKSESSFSADPNAPTSLVVPLDIPAAYRLHLLLNTGNGFTIFKDKIVGEVRATCNGATLKVTDLRLGREVREWHSADNRLVTSASRAREVWRGSRTDAPEFEGHIDLLSLDLPPPCRAGRLTAVEVVDTSAETASSLDPALNLVGLTVEHYRP